MPKLTNSADLTNLPGFWAHILSEVVFAVPIYVGMPKRERKIYFWKKGSELAPEAGGEKENGLKMT